MANTKQKQTASEFYFEHLKKMEAILQQFIDLQEQGEKAFQGFTVAELMSMTENTELNELGEKVVIMIKQISKDL
jgi:hypothetical protein